MEKLAAKNKAKLIDLLTERMQFERIGVKLYDAILAKMEASTDTSVRPMIDQMREHRDQEHAHEEYLEDLVRQLGGDAHGETEMSRLMETESSGIEKVIMNPHAELSHLFHALFAAELVDNAGWDLLVQLADEAGDRDAKKGFKRCLHEEEEHLLFMRKTMEKIAARDVLGEDWGHDLGS